MSISCIHPMHWDLDGPYQPHPTSPTPGALSPIWVAGTMNDEPWEHPNHYDASTKTTENSEALNLFCSSLKSTSTIGSMFICIYLPIRLYSWFFSKISVVRNIAVPWVLWVHHRFWFLGSGRGTRRESYPLQKIHHFESMMFWELPLWWDVSYLPGRVKNRCVRSNQWQKVKMGDWLHVWSFIVSS